MYPKDSKEAKILSQRRLPSPYGTDLEQLVYNEQLAANLRRLHAILRICPGTSKNQADMVTQTPDPERMAGADRVAQGAAIHPQLAILARAMPARPWRGDLGGRDGGRGLDRIRALDARGCHRR